MTEVDREEVRRVARLARLELSEAEVERLSEEMERVLSRFAELEALEAGQDGPGGATAAGEADAPAETSAGDALRPDRPDPDPLRRRPDRFAPEWEDGFFLVPRLSALDGEEP